MYGIIAGDSKYAWSSHTQVARVRINRVIIKLPVLIVVS